MSEEAEVSGWKGAALIFSIFGICVVGFLSPLLFDTKAEWEKECDREYGVDGSGLTEERQYYVRSDYWNSSTDPNCIGHNETEQQVLEYIRAREGSISYNSEEIMAYTSLESSYEVGNTFDRLENKDLVFCDKDDFRSRCRLVNQTLREELKGDEG